ncbi:MAG: lysine--tRNA ligase [Parcubacteria group bacterium CG1_02_40_82]|uniref:Lysine--tRNA ligase n=1 Tax=Candidatus Portnoybacteria bacterium CG_4_9_14_3_um_filter_40_10 TaxID=1974804 RepID=A0A2M7YMT2_9BACT|nr:MAG: lysine--tRNA ligase [Parcubacteria group bacterium CG1_02_40_82]PJA64212.1 MAG: lysine--tRNA ligase [Candidatus Portnoybacteria bacterium CG_4_9_14_3_um_filter_40_10]
MSLEKIKADRLKKLENIKAAKINPFPSKTGPRLFILDVLEDFDILEKEKKEISLAGRLRSQRTHGGSSFANLEDFSGQIQIYFKKDELGEKNYNFFAENLDIGDFIQAQGEVFKTQKGERTLLVKKYKILAKSLNQLPEKWHGLKDVEERFRKRYLDLLMNKDVRARFAMRSKIIKELRAFLEAEGFLEVETPVLQPLPGGALAKPFRTHLNALNMDLYLRIAPELYLKRLLVGGFEKIYEIGRCFRNEGMDKLHNPDFTMLEFYWAYADYQDVMNLVERMFGFLVPEMEIEFQDNKINFTDPFKRISIGELIMEHYKIDIGQALRMDLEKILIQAGEKPEKDAPDCKLIDEIFKTIRPNIIKPTFVTNHPIEMSPLAKASEQNPKEAQRFQMIVAGMEIINAYSELNNPKEQAERMKEQEKGRQDDEIQRFDRDYIEALEYGMPPAAGLGLGVDRLVQFLTNAANIREVILFPTMRQKE